MDSLIHGVLQSMDWLNQWMWILFSAMLFVITSIGLHPLDYRYDSTFLHRLLVIVRRSILITLPILMLVVPLALYFAYAGVVDAESGSQHYIHWYLNMAEHYWRLALASVFSSFLLKIVHVRYVLPRWSNIKRKYRVHLTHDKLSDIRLEKHKYQHKSFDPVEYYQEGKIFFGLDKDNQPIYIPLSDWIETNMQVIGPTRFGKGILLGCQLDQAIRNGFGAFYIDPKGDKNIPYIMADTAKAMGRPFIYCDMNDDGVGGWHPFLGGSDRSKRARFLMAFGLEDTGNESDFYKIKERGVIDELMKTTTKISGLLQIFRAQKTKGYQDEAKRLYGKLVEWEKVKSLNPKGEGLNIEKSMLNNAVVYIKGSLDDAIVRDATRVLIVEIIQEAKRLEAQRKSHLTVVIDEIRFLMSNQIADASATITGTDTNLILAYQSKTDLRNVNDVNVDSGAAEASINTNCQLKFIYGTQDPDTARWAEEMSGKQQKMVTQREAMEVGHMGEERWEGYRTVAQKEETYITLNTMLSLEKRAGVLYQPSQLPEIIFTCFVKTAYEHCFEKRIPTQLNNKGSEDVVGNQKEAVLKKESLDGADRNELRDRKGISIEELG